MKRKLNEEEVENALNNIRVINEIEGIIIDEKTEAAGRRILSGQTTVEEELSKILTKHSDFLDRN